MIRTSLLVSALLGAAAMAASDPVMHVTFDAHPPGVYTTDMLRRDFATHEFGSLSDRGAIVENGASGRCLRMAYPAGSIGPSEGGGNMRAKLPPREEYTLEFRVFFEPGFDWRKGGKLHGLAGGAANTGGKKTTGDGWSSRFMWSADGKAIMYVYHAEQKGDYGDAFSLNVRFTAGKWHTIKQRVKVNRPSEADGELEVWFDGKPVMLKRNLRYRTVSKALVEYFQFSTFHGGSTRDWAPRHDSFARFDDFVIR